MQKDMVALSMDLMFTFLILFQVNMIYIGAIQFLCR